MRQEFGPGHQERLLGIINFLKENHDPNAYPYVVAPTHGVDPNVFTGELHQYLYRPSRTLVGQLLSRRQAADLVEIEISYQNGEDAIVRTSRRAMRDILSNTDPLKSPSPRIHTLFLNRNK